MIVFDGMVQINSSNDYQRAVRREENVDVLDSAVANSLPPLPADVAFFGENGEFFLPTFESQIIQVSKAHPEKEWLYGSVLYDPLLVDAEGKARGDSPSLRAILSDALHDRPTTGWFPKALSKPADAQVMQKLMKSLGGEGMKNLHPPQAWDPNEDGVIRVSAGSSEYHEVSSFFLAALGEHRNHVLLVNVERIQSVPLWQSYAVKKETMKARDTKHPENLVNNKRMDDRECKWLFHGTTCDNVPKIVNQGFNRAFAGRNAVAYGKGVYFARDASYSSCSAYSTPDDLGIQYMFLCRVAVGDWCRGSYGQLTPDPKPRNRFELFDTTVDDETDPSIFVVYHDAQAYPDYLVSFQQTGSSEDC
jgi:poly [ADP-ribose] polymerase 10/14/15